MVELTEIRDESAATTKPQAVPAEPINESEKKDINLASKFDDDDDEDSEFDDDFDENETLLERLAALKDIVPPKQRQNVSKIFSTASTFLSNAFKRGGSLTWALTTSALLLGVPLSLSILAEQQLIEMEKTFDLQKDANDLLGQGEEQPVATA